MENEGDKNPKMIFWWGGRMPLIITTTVYRPLLTNNMEAKHGDRWKMTFLFHEGEGAGSMLVFGGVSL